MPDNFTSMLSDPDFAKMPVDQQRTAMAAHDPIFSKMGDGDVIRFVQAHQAPAQPVQPQIPSNSLFTKHPSSLGIRKMKETESPQNKLARIQAGEKTETGLEIGTAAAGAALPVIGAISAPVTTGLSLGGAYLGGEAAQRGAKWVGVQDPDMLALAKFGGALTGGLAGGLAPNKMASALESRAPMIYRIITAKALPAAGIPDTGLAHAAAENPPLRPLVGTPEQWKAFDQQMNVLQQEAKATGMYSAARGKIGKVPNYQGRAYGELTK